MLRTLTFSFTDKRRGLRETIGTGTKLGASLDQGALAISTGRQSSHKSRTMLKTCGIFPGFLYADE